MPDNSNPKMKHALFFHRNKKIKLPPVQAKAGQTYNLLAGEETKKLFFPEQIFGERRQRRRRTECDWNEGPNPFFCEKPSWGRRCTIGYRNTLSGREPAYHAGRVFWAVDFSTGKEGNKIYMVSWSALGKEGNKYIYIYIWSVDLPWARKETNIYGRLICPWARKETKYVVSWSARGLSIHRSFETTVYCPVIRYHVSDPVYYRICGFKYRATP